MANDFGLSFIPTDQGTGQQPGRPGGLGGSLSPVQQAIQMLSLRLPHVFGAQSLAPGPLLTSAGGGGMSVGPGGGGSLEAILRLLFGQHAGPSQLPLPSYTPVPPQPMGWGNARDHWPGPGPVGLPTTLPPAPLPRVMPGFVPSVPLPGRVPGQAPAPYPGVPPYTPGQPPYEAPRPSLPMPNYTPVPTKPIGWGNAPDNRPGTVGLPPSRLPRLPIPTPNYSPLPPAASAPSAPWRPESWQSTPNDFAMWGI